MPTMALATAARTEPPGSSGIRPPATRTSSAVVFSSGCGWGSSLRMWCVGAGAGPWVLQERQGPGARAPVVGFGAHRHMTACPRLLDGDTRPARRMLLRCPLAHGEGPPRRVGEHRGPARRALE